MDPPPEFDTECFMPLCVNTYRNCEKDFYLLENDGKKLLCAELPKEFIPEQKCFVCEDHLVYPEGEESFNRVKPKQGRRRLLLLRALNKDPDDLDTTKFISKGKVRLAIPDLEAEEDFIFHLPPYNENDPISFIPEPLRQDLEYLQEVGEVLKLMLDRLKEKQKTTKKEDIDEIELLKSIIYPRLPRRFSEEKAEVIKRQMDAVILKYRRVRYGNSAAGSTAGTSTEAKMEIDNKVEPDNA